MWGRWVTWWLLVKVVLFLTADHCAYRILLLHFPCRYHTIASWATNLMTFIREANKALWLSVAFIVLFAALMSFFTGRFFQKSVDAAPTQDGDSWMTLERILWPFARLRHNGPPPVWHPNVCILIFKVSVSELCKLVTFSWEIRAWNHRFLEWFARYFIVPLFVMTFQTKIQWGGSLPIRFFNGLFEEALLLFVKIYWNKERFKFLYSERWMS